MAARCWRGRFVPCIRTVLNDVESCGAAPEDVWVLDASMCWGGVGGESGCAVVVCAGSRVSSHSPSLLSSRRNRERRIVEVSFSGPPCLGRTWRLSRVFSSLWDSRSEREMGQCRLCQPIVLHIIHTVLPDSFHSLLSPSRRIPKLPPLKSPHPKHNMSRD